MGDNRVKKYMMQQNIYACKFGIFQDLPVMKSQKSFYNDDFNIAPPYEYGNVLVNTKHSIDVANEYAQNGLNPVVVNTVSKDFTGNNLDMSEGILDAYINIRTSFNKTLNTYGLYPLNDGVVYAQNVYIIRDDAMQFVKKEQVKKISMITVSLDKDIEYETVINEKHFPVDKYIEISQMIETIFQTAIVGKNDTIIFDDFGCKTYNYPINNIISMLNTSIYKYGHLVKNIVVAINVSNHNEMGYSTKFNENLVHPQVYIQEFIEKEKKTMSEMENLLNEQKKLVSSANDKFNPFANISN